MGAHQHTWRAAGLAVLLAVAALATGCSSQKKVPPAPAGSGQAMSLVSDADVHATRKRTPERTVMTWWQLAQYRDVNDSRALFTAAARRDLDRAGYPILLVRFLGPWIRNGRPKITQVQHVGSNHAIVLADTRFNVPVGTDLVRHDNDVVSFALDRVGSDWLISDPSWVVQTSNGLQQAAQQAQAQAQQRSRRAAP